MYKIYSMNENETGEKYFIHGEENALQQHIFNGGIPFEDYGMAAEFNNLLQYELTVEELKKEFPESKFVRVLPNKN